MGDGAPDGYSGGSVLEQPTVPVEIKVFQGGGEVPGGYVAHSLLQSPINPVKVEVFQGGGGIDVATLQFRAIPITKIVEYPEYLNSICILEFVEEVKPQYTIDVSSSKIDVIPIKLPELDLSGIAIKGKPIDEVFFYDEKGGELKSLEPSGNKLMFYSTTLTPTTGIAVALKKGVPGPAGPLDVSGASGPLDVSGASGPLDVSGASGPLDVSGVSDISGASVTPDISGASNKSESSPEGKDPTTVILYNKLRVRYVNDAIKDSIMNREFKDDERLLFNRLGFNEPCIIEYLNMNRKEFYEFWKTYVNDDFTDIFISSISPRRAFIHRFMDMVLKERSKCLLQVFFRTRGPLPAAEPFSLYEEKVEAVPTSTPAPSTSASSSSTPAPSPSTSNPSLSTTTPASATAPATTPATTKGVRITRAKVPKKTNPRAEAAEKARQEVEAKRKEEEEKPALTLPERQTYVKTLKQKINTIFTSSIPSNEKLTSLYTLLNNEIYSYKIYTNKFLNVQDTSTFTTKTFNCAKISVDEFINKKYTMNEALNTTLKRLVTVDITAFPDDRKAKFIEFFKKVVPPELHTAMESYVKGVAKGGSRKGIPTRRVKRVKQ